MSEISDAEVYRRQNIRLEARVKELEQAWDKASELQEGYLNRIEELELERDGLRAAVEQAWGMFISDDTAGACWKAERILAAALKPPPT